MLALILERLQPTFYLMLLTMGITVACSVPFGVLAAWRQSSALDRGVMVFAVLSFSVPVFAVGYLLAYVFSVSLGWLPVQGYVSPQEGFGAFLAQRSSCRRSASAPSSSRWRAEQHAPR